MATRFDIFKNDPIFSGGLLGIPSPEEEARLAAEEQARLAAEEQARLLEEQMAAEAAAAAAAQAQSDPLAPLPEAPVATPKPEPEVFAVSGPEEEAPAFEVDGLATAKTDKPVFEVTGPTEERAAAFMPEGIPAGPEPTVPEPVAKPEEQVRPEYVDATNNWVSKLKAQRDAEIEAEKALPTRNINVKPEDAIAAKWTQEAINSPEMWDATPAEMAAAARQLFSAAGSTSTAPMADWERLAEWRKNPLNRTPSPVIPKGEKTDQKVTPEDAPTIVQSIKKGAATTVELSQRAIQAVQEVVGADEAAAASGRRADYARGLREIMPEGVKLTEINSWGKALQWTGQTFAEQGVLMAGPVAGGAVGKIIGGSLGAKLGAFGPSWVLGTGEAAGTIKEINPEQKASLMTLATGSAVAALDSVLPGKSGPALSAPSARMLARNWPSGCCYFRPRTALWPCSSGSAPRG